MLDIRSSSSGRVHQRKSSNQKLPTQGLFKSPHLKGKNVKENKSNNVSPKQRPDYQKMLNDIDHLALDEKPAEEDDLALNEMPADRSIQKPNNTLDLTKKTFSTPMEFLKFMRQHSDAKYIYLNKTPVSGKILTKSTLIKLRGQNKNLKRISYNDLYYLKDPSKKIRAPLEVSMKDIDSLQD